MRTFEIYTFKEREFIIDTLKKFFNEESDTNLDQLWALIHWHDILEEEELERLEKIFENVKEITINSLHKFELHKIKKTQHP